MTVDLNRLILGKSYNSTKVFRTAQHVVQAILLGGIVPLLILLLIWDLTDNPNPVPGVVVIAGLVMLCFFFSYVFVVPDDLTSSATDRTLAIASKIFAYTSRGLTSEAALGASKIILSETIASAICFTDGKQVLASWGEDSAKCPAGTPVETITCATLNGAKMCHIEDETGSIEAGKCADLLVVNGDVAADIHVLNTDNMDVIMKDGWIVEAGSFGEANKYSA